MTDRPNVLLLVGAGHAARHTGWQGSAVETPTIDGLARRGTAFAAAYAPAPAPTPARVGLLSGLRAPRTRVFEGGDPLPDVGTLPEWLGEAGYATCFVGALGVGGARQFAGFDDRPYGDLTPKAGAQFDPPTNPKARGSPFASKADGVGGAYGHRYDPLNPDRRAPDPWRGLTGDAGRTWIPAGARAGRSVVAETTDWLREHDARSADPWLLCASFSRPAPPLTAPRRHVEAAERDLPEAGVDAAPDHPFLRAKRDRDRVQDHKVAEVADPDDEQVRRSRAAYRGSVAYLDEVIGDLLAAAEREGLLADTIVVYAGAAGTMLGEQGLWWGDSYHDPATRVPLAVQTPAHRAGERAPATVETPTSLLDVAPTLCGLAGVECPGDRDGADLSAAVRTGAEPDRGPVVSDSLSEPGAFRVVRDGARKHVRFADARDLAFDLAADPGETAPVDADPPAAADIDFGEALAARERARESVPVLAAGAGTTGNAYCMPDGRLVDADTALYKPDVLAETAARVFEDWPDGG